MKDNENEKSGLKKASAVVLLAVASLPYVAATIGIVKSLKKSDDKNEK